MQNLPEGNRKTCAISPANVNLTCQEEWWWLHSEWYPKFQHAMWGSDANAREVQDYGILSTQRTTTFMTVYEQLQYIVQLYPFLERCRSSMYPSRPIIPVNNNLVPAKTRQSCGLHLKVDKSGVFVIPPPPGFLIAPKEDCAQCLRAIDNNPDEDLDIDSLIEEFRTKSKVHEEYESLFFLRNFLIDNLNANFAKSGDIPQNVYEYFLRGASFEKIAEIASEFLRRFGFDAVFLKPSCASMTFFNMLAMELCCNEVLFSEVVSACNVHAEGKKRMPYTNNFS